MSRVVYLHIGAPKTGTTYLQDRLTINARRLAGHGVRVPSGSRLVGADLFQFRAALDLLGQDWGGPPGHAEGAWPALMKKVRRARGTVIISHEILAPARPEVVARVMADLEGSEVHIVYSSRDLARQLPAGWQESIKQGRRWKFRRFCDKYQAGQSWFYRALDVPTVLSTWGAHLPPDRVHVVTVPSVAALESGQRDALWLRFCAAFGIDPAWAPEDSQRANRSMGIPETALIRQLNRRIERSVRREAAYDKLIRDVLAQRELAARASTPVRLAPRHYDWVEQEAERWIDWLEGSRVHVLGDLDDLRPVRPAEDERWRDPDRVRARSVLGVGVDALDAMTREAARRPDPDHQLGALVRQGAERLRNH